MTIGTIAKGVRHFLYQNAPQILSGVACGGVVATSIFAGKGAVKLEKKGISLKRFKEAPKSEKKHLLKEAGKVLWPTVISGGATIGCVIAAQKINSKRLAIVAGMYTMTKEAFDLYQTKTKQIAGDKQEQKIREAVAQERYDKKPLDNQVQKMVIFGNMDGKVIFRDLLSGRDFFSDMVSIRESVCRLNHRLHVEHWIDLNDFYNEVGLEETKQGNEMGWRIDHDTTSGQIEIDYDAVIDQRTQMPVITLDYDVEPKSKHEYPFY